MGRSITWFNFTSKERDSIFLKDYLQNLTGLGNLVPYALSIFLNVYNWESWSASRDRCLGRGWTLVFQVRKLHCASLALHIIL